MSKARLSKSGVSWTNYSWGIVDGCTKVSEACKNCYAETMATRFWKDRKFSEVRTHPERLEAPLNTKKGGKVFVAPMGDLFHPDVPFEFIIKVFYIMTQAHQHTFQLLTKRPERVLEFFQQRGHAIVRDNIWIGITAENQEQADKRIPVLLQIPAAVRFVSVEPMLGPVDLTDIELPNEINERGFHINSLTDQDTEHFYNDHAKLDLVICGGESGPHARPMHPLWAKNLKNQCVSAGVPFYFKQWGRWLDVSASFQAKKMIWMHTDGRILPGDQSSSIENWQGLALMCADNIRKFEKQTLLDGRGWQQMPEVK